MGPNNSIIVTVIVTPRKTLRGNEGNLEVRFSATSFNPENNTTLNDGSNEAFTILKTAAQTDITLDSPGYITKGGGAKISVHHVLVTMVAILAEE